MLQRGIDCIKNKNLRGGNRICETPSVEDTHIWKNSRISWFFAHLIVPLQQNNGNVEIMKRYNLFPILLLAVMFAACSNADSPVVRGMHSKKPYATPELIENIIAVLKQYK